MFGCSRSVPTSAGTRARRRAWSSGPAHVIDHHRRRQRREGNRRARAGPAPQKYTTTCQPGGAMRCAISASTSRGVKSTSHGHEVEARATARRMQRAGASSVTSRPTDATRARGRRSARNASASARLSLYVARGLHDHVAGEAQVIAQPEGFSFGASHSVYCGQARRGKRSAGPNTWQWASTARARRRRSAKLAQVQVERRINQDPRATLGRLAASRPLQAARAYREVEAELAERRGRHAYPRSSRASVGSGGDQWLFARGTTDAVVVGAITTSPG